MRYYYTPFVQHMIRFYHHTNGIKPNSFKTEAEKLNWECVDTAVHNSKADTVALVMEVVCKPELRSMNDRIREYAASHSVKEDMVWQHINQFEAQCAKARGLI